MALIQVPSSEVRYTCSCKNYRNSADGSQLGSAHQIGQHRSSTKCGGEAVHVFVAPDQAASGGPEELGTWTPAAPLGVLGPLAVEPDQGQVQISRFKESLSVDASLHAIYDTFVVHMGYEGTFGEWVLECLWDYFSAMGFGLQVVIPGGQTLPPVGFAPPTISRLTGAGRG